MIYPDELPTDEELSAIQDWFELLTEERENNTEHSGWREPTVVMKYFNVEVRRVDPMLTALQKFLKVFK